MDERPGQRLTVDPDRLEEGLQRLRALGYLQSPAEEYLARRVGLRASAPRTALAVGLWVGGALGLLGSLLLMVSAVLSEPALLGRPPILLTLWLEFVLVLVVVASACTGIAAWLVLVGRGRRTGFALGGIEVLVVATPALASALYLGDRLGRAIGAEIGGPVWWLVAVLVAVVVGAVGSAVAWSVSGAIALARMYASGVDQSFVLSRRQRQTPWVLLTATTLLLLLVGPYRGLAPLPLLDDVVPALAAPPSPLFVVTMDGVEEPSRVTAAPVTDLVASSSVLHPAAYWNEIATGFEVREHGVADAAAAGVRGWDSGVGTLTEDPLLDVLLRHLLPGVGLGETIATDRRDLRRPPIWEIAAVAGRRARAVNCWATYPAARREGLEVVTDREFLRLFDGSPADPHLAWPPSIASDAEGRWRLALQGERALVPGHSEGLEWLARHAPADTALAKIWDLATASDLHHLRRATQELDPVLGPTLVVVHLNGLDIVTRALRNRPQLESRELLDAMTRFVSEALRRHAPGRTHEVVVLMRSPVGDATDPRAWAAGPGDLPREPRAWAAWMLWMQGIVPARDMVVPSTVSMRESPDIRPATFGRLDRTSDEADRSGADLERLRSLGYIGG